MAAWGFVLTCRVGCAVAAFQQRHGVGCHRGQVDHMLAAGGERPEARGAAAVVVGEDLHRVA
jgi:hypothetical protein